MYIGGPYDEETRIYNYNEDKETYEAQTIRKWQLNILQLAIVHNLE